MTGAAPVETFTPADAADDPEAPALVAAAPEQRLAALAAAARRLGAVRLGVAAADDLAVDRERLTRWLTAGRHGTMAYLAKGDRAAPRALFPEARTVLVVAVPYAPLPVAPAPAPGLRGEVAGYARGGDYHPVLWRLLKRLGRLVAAAMGAAVRGRPCVDTAPLLERAVAARAGVGFIGKNALVIAPGAGSYLLLGELLVDVDLPPSTPAEPRCGSCRACLDACPTNAFPAPHVLDARRCLAYLTIENTGPIPREFRRALGQRVFGCDVCQQVCPFNGAAADRQAVPPDLAPRFDTVDLAAWLDLGAAAYRRTVKGTALRRGNKTTLARNAAVALGNSGDPAAIPPLLEALRSHGSALVRAHTAWALGELVRLDEAAVRAALKVASKEDTDPAVRDEARRSLSP